MTDPAPDGNGARRLRVVQWATGNVGARALRGTIEHPDLQLVGVHVTGPDKVGRDAGELAGVAPVGVAATNRIEDVIALKPDCVLYMPLQTSFDEVCALLEAGINVVTTRGDFHRPASMDPTARERVEAACRAGNSSIHSSGSSPGFITEAVPIVLASIQRRLDEVRINEFADCSSRDSPLMIFQIMGFGQQPDPSGTANGMRAAYLRDAFGPSLTLLAESLGKTVDGLEASAGVGVARQDVEIAAGTIPAGTVAAQRTRISAMSGGQPVATMTATWYVSADVDTDDGETWDFRDSGWHVEVAGDCPLDIAIRFPVAPEDYAEMTPGLTANRPVNIVPYLCAAEPGIRTTADLPQIIARLG